jgi:hypothetical protein
MSADASKDKMGPVDDITAVNPDGHNVSANDEKSTVEVLGDSGASYNYALANDPHRYVSCFFV